MVFRDIHPFRLDWRCVQEISGTHAILSQVQATKTTLGGNFREILPHISVVFGYTVLIYVLVIIFFHRKMRGDKDDAKHLSVLS